ncbi:chromosome condensation protein CrcB [[Phormidium ambiguum] IAM M-71]|uniref:Fluoride-specific ion channel FluC n=1 Tax=[Phormidium ambiguum] IAM M-71 TaxID=454136 RepID=A0A1U7I3T1_9CYAN|nr:fluoride efflux transporter CrcB [Phormidium ambiguum]OKH30788.1 chromosome condensation protein CrcB [Phormidium ambiguum IAM M-71]
MDFGILAPLFIALGAIPGALSRYYLTLFCTKKFGSSFPYGTMIINLSGAFLMGFFATLFQSVNAPYLSLLITVGFLGSYTTFSTYQLETWSLIGTGNYKKALLYWIGSAVLGFLCVEIGMFLARQL